MRICWLFPFFYTILYTSIKRLNNCLDESLAFSLLLVIAIVQTSGPYKEELIISVMAFYAYCLILLLLSVIFLMTSFEMESKSLVSSFIRVREFPLAFNLSKSPKTWREFEATWKLVSDMEFFTTTIRLLINEASALCFFLHSANMVPKA